MTGIEKEIEIWEARLGEKEFNQGAVILKITTLKAWLADRQRLKLEITRLKRVVENDAIKEVRTEKELAEANETIKRLEDENSELRSKKGIPSNMKMLEAEKKPVLTDEMDGMPELDIIKEAIKEGT